MKQILTIAIFAVWTLAVIYGTYNNTVRNAEVNKVNGGYEITYHNTGEIHFYEVTR